MKNESFLYQAREKYLLAREFLFLNRPRPAACEFATAGTPKR